MLDFWHLSQKRALPSELDRFLSHLHGNNGMLGVPLSLADAALCSKRLLKLMRAPIA